MDDMTALALDRVLNEIPLGLVAMLDAPVADAARARPGALACAAVATPFAAAWNGDGRDRDQVAACETARRRCGQRTLFAYDWDHADGPPPGRMVARPPGGMECLTVRTAVADPDDVLRLAWRVALVRGRGGAPECWRVADLYRPHTEWVSAVSGHPLPASGYDPTDL